MSPATDLGRATLEQENVTSTTLLENMTINNTLSMTNALLENVTNIVMIPTEAGGVTQFINQTVVGIAAAAAGNSGQITNFTIPVDMVFGQVKFTFF